MTDLSHRPGHPPAAQAAWLLGLAGLIPFFAGAAALWAGPQRLGAAVFSVPSLLLAYGATIASFLGGVRWGVETARPEGPRVRELILSTTPQLAAWGLVAAPGAPLAWRFGGLAVLLAVQGAADASARDLPAWFRALRVPLAVGATAALAAGALWASTLARAYAPSARLPSSASVASPDM